MHITCFDIVEWVTESTCDL